MLVLGHGMAMRWCDGVVWWMGVAHLICLLMSDLTGGSEFDGKGGYSG